MNQKYIDILFALFIKGGQVSLKWLVELFCKGKAGGEKEIQQNISALISAKLITLSLKGTTPYAVLTEKGNHLAVAAADVLADKMMEQWQTVQSA